MNTAGNGASGLGAAEDVSRQTQSYTGVMDGSSSSKVTVEYHDPSGLFSIVHEQLAARFPLRNLHWKSPNRPLRSIDSLHVDLVPSKESVHTSGVFSPGLAPPEGPPGASSPAPSSTEIIRPPAKERRHQIPGLRQTPYLKIYLLRCDDSDTYKSTARKQLREWVKTNTPPSQSSSSSNTQENHDAFEWMILHVVIPDTSAASQPRGSTASNISTGEKEKANRWARGTSTILEKIRADFNVSSKSAPDRVAQIRLQKDVVPPHILPSAGSVSSPPLTESPQEQERVWNDIIAKFKTLILTSFGLRVSQYEEDLREKEAQRVLPGWNFCTFFILKEGLARGFESVGLVEDALLGYDELSIGLDTIIHDQASDGSQTQGGVILSFSEDIYEQTAKILKRSQNGNGARKEPQLQTHDAKPINAQKKNYRDLILSNNISAFDFRCYIFARQMTLLLRLGNARSARSDLAAKLQPKPNPGSLQRSMDDATVGTKSSPSALDTEDLLSLAELCSRALNFVTFAGRLLRDDLLNGAEEHEVDFPGSLIDNLVRSWTYAAIQQIIDETATSSLPVSQTLKDAASGSSGKMPSFGSHMEEQKLSFTEPKTMIHPSRSSSLNYGRPASAEPLYAAPTTTGQVVYENGQYQDRPTPVQESAIPKAKSGIQELAGTRAQLYVVQRRILESAGKALGWTVGWTAVLSSMRENEQLSEIDLNGPISDEDMEPNKDKPPSSSSTSGLSEAALVDAVSSIERFRQFYEILSDLIVKHYRAAGQTKSEETILGDLAALKYELGDFAAAAMYFGRRENMYADDRWNFVEATMLKMHSQCLKKLHRKDDYVRTLLNLLAKSTASRKSLRTKLPRTSLPESSTVWFNDDNVDTAGLFTELIAFSERLPKDRIEPMAKYFDDIHVEPYVRHFDDKDGFQLRLQFRHVLEDEIEIRHAKIHLVHADSAQGKDIWLDCSESLHLKKGLCRTWLRSSVNTTGPYVVDKIMLEANRIIFLHEPFTKTEAVTPLGITTSVSAASLKAAKKARVLCFPRIEAFQARMYLSHFIHIDRRRSIDIELRSGWNNITHAEVRLRAASAGLRLRTGDATGTNDDIAIKDTPSPGVFSIVDMPPDSIATFQVPYELETIIPELSIKIEVEYRTENGQFQYHSSFTIPIELPLDVNVHDHFKNDSLYSKFNIKTSSDMPLEILDVGLDGSEEFQVSGARRLQKRTMVFPKQPVSITYKIAKQVANVAMRRKSQAPNVGSLALSVKYRCMNEDVVERVREMFAAAVENSPVHRLARLLIATFAERLERRVLPHQYEKIALLEKVDLGPFDGIGWSDCIDSLPRIVREDTQSWLRKWHETHRTIHIPSTSELKSPFPSTAPSSSRPPRLIVITVSIPQTHILHTASLALKSSEASSLSSATTIAVAGQPVMTELFIKHTRRWGSPDTFTKATGLSSPEDAIEFVYSVEANPDFWLVAGQRRAHFVAKEDEGRRFPILLVPLKPGNILLPNIEIRARLPPKPEQQRESGGPAVADEQEGEQLNCETDYLSNGESIMVVPDVRSSTVGIGDIGRAGSAIWLESEGRV